ncbi:hypothetical protein NC651_008459 [Populus alba x Populus x berolinensis]|nr:hypothetical protein NC651_008459 [Populus alba x Populus x berolinensis]
MGRPRNRIMKEHGNLNYAINVFHGLQQQKKLHLQGIRKSATLGFYYYYLSLILIMKRMERG